MAKRRKEKDIKHIPIKDMKTAHELIEALQGLTNVSQRMIQMLKDKVNLYDIDSLNYNVVTPLRDMKTIRRVIPIRNSNSPKPVAKERTPSPNAENGRTMPAENGRAMPAENSRAMPAENSKAMPAENGRARPAEYSRARLAENVRARPAENVRARPAENVRARPAENVRARPTQCGRGMKCHEIAELFQSIRAERTPKTSTCSSTSTTIRSETSEKILFSSFGSCDDQNNINDVAENHKKAMERSAKDQNEQITRPKKRGRSKRKNKSHSQGHPSLNENDNRNRTDPTLEPYVLVKNICSDTIAKSYKDKCEQGSSLSGSSSKDNEDVVDDTEQSETGDSYSHNESSRSDFTEDQNSHNEKSGSECMEECFNIDETKESDNENCTNDRKVGHSSTVVKDPNTSEPEYNIEPGCSHVYSEGGNSNQDLYSDETDATTGVGILIVPDWDSYSASFIPESPAHDSDDCPETQSENVGKAEAFAEFPNLNICASTSSKDPELELKPAMKEVVENALNTGTPEDRLVKTATEYLLRKDIQTLDGLNWLNDKVINSYFELIMERSKKENYPSVHAFNTFFYKTYETKGYSKVKRWTEKLDIFRFDLNFVPIHSDIHWSLAVIDHRSSKICFYDSMNHLGKELTLLPEYICQEYEEKKCTSLGNYTIEVMENIPLQDNGSDCGMFMLKYAEFISRGAKVTFNQEHMQYFRKRMIYELLTKQLL